MTKAQLRKLVVSNYKDYRLINIDNILDNELNIKIVPSSDSISSSFLFNNDKEGLYDILTDLMDRIFLFIYNKSPLPDCFDWTSFNDDSEGSRLTIQLIIEAFNKEKKIVCYSYHVQFGLNPDKEISVLEEELSRDNDWKINRYRDESIEGWRTKTGISSMASNPHLSMISLCYPEFVSIFNKARP